MRPEPDFAGFEDAQVTLREKFGREVEFFTPQPSTWPPGTKLDPETGRPYDPSIPPLASGFSSAAIRCSIVQRPILFRLRDERVSNALGQMSETTVVAIVRPDDVWAASGATRANYLGSSYKITDLIHDALGPVERYVAFMERR